MSQDQEYHRQAERTHLLQQILDNISYKDWQFRLWPMGDGHLLQIVFEAPNVLTREIELQYCRKWWIDKNMTTNEIVRTVFLACETAERHECAENFQYLGVRVANPHFPVPVYAEFVKDYPNHSLSRDDSRQLPPVEGQVIFALPNRPNESSIVENPSAHLEGTRVRLLAEQTGYSQFGSRPLGHEMLMHFFNGHLFLVDEGAEHILWDVKPDEYEIYDRPGPSSASDTISDFDTLLSGN